MNVDLTKLFAVLESEIAVGEELQRNLEAQKRAILLWDMGSLLEQIEAREPWLRSLNQLEEERSKILRRINPTTAAMTLRDIISMLPQGRPEGALLDTLRERTRMVFTHLHNEEQSLHELMQTLLAHLQGALSSLTRPLAPVYSETGIASPVKFESGLLNGKA